MSSGSGAPSLSYSVRKVTQQALSPVSGQTSQAGIPACWLVRVWGVIALLEWHLVVSSLVKTTGRPWSDMNFPKSSPIAVLMNFRSTFSSTEHVEVLFRTYYSTYTLCTV